VIKCLKRFFEAFFVLYFFSSPQANAFVYQSKSVELVVKEIICPKVCLKEYAYVIIFSNPVGNATADRGTFRGDSLVGIDPKSDYRVTITLSNGQGQTTLQTIDLPICDPIIPRAPLVISQSICEGQPIASLKAIAPPGGVIDWYASAIGGAPIAINSADFTPLQAGTYYAQSRIIDSGCTSLARAAGTLLIQKAYCAVITTRRIRFSETK
jgi:Ig-like domain CHU_C associated